MSTGYIEKYAMWGHLQNDMIYLDDPIQREASIYLNQNNFSYLITHTEEHPCKIENVMLLFVNYFLKDNLPFQRLNYKGFSAWYS